MCKPDILLEMKREWMSELVLDYGSPKLGHKYNEMGDIRCPECGILMDKTFDKDQKHIRYETCAQCEGMFFDAGPAILILGPLLGPTMQALEIEPLHFAIIMCVNLTVGLATPPMGLVLFVASTLTRLPILEIAKDMWPFLMVHVVVVLLITYVPALTLTLPRLLGLGI